MKLTIKTLKGGKFEVEADPSTTIANVKGIIVSWSYVLKPEVWDIKEVRPSQTNSVLSQPRRHEREAKSATHQYYFFLSLKHPYYFSSYSSLYTSGSC